MDIQTVEDQWPPTSKNRDTQHYSQTVWKVKDKKENLKIARENVHHMQSASVRLWTDFLAENLVGQKVMGMIYSKWWKKNCQPWLLYPSGPCSKNKIVDQIKVAEQNMESTAPDKTHQKYAYVWNSSHAKLIETCRRTQQPKIHYFYLTR